MKKTLIPLAVFVVLLVFLAIGLTRDPHEIPSPLIGKPAPDFTAPVLDGGGQRFAAKDMLGKVWLALAVPALAIAITWIAARRTKA